MKPIGILKFPVPTREFPVPSKKFPVPRKKIPCSAKNREFACNALKLLRELTQESATIAALAGNFLKFPVNFPVLREFEDRGRSSLQRPSLLDMIRILETPY